MVYEYKKKVGISCSQGINISACGELKQKKFKIVPDAVYILKNMKIFPGEDNVIKCTLNVV